MEVFLSEDVCGAKQKVFSQIKPLFSRKNRKFAFYDINHLAFKDKCENAIFQMIKSHAYTSESASTGSFETFFESLFEDKNIDGNFLPKPLSKKNVFSLLNSFSNNFISSLILECLDLSGLEGKIILSKELSNDDTLIEAAKGCFFSGLNASFKLEHQKYFDAKILCIDGYIESVSEINRLLEDAASEKETVFLFVRGMSDDVLHTLKVNYDRKSLQIIPVIIKFDLDSINTLNDIAIASGADVVSSLKGQLINCIDLKSSPRVDSVEVSNTGILIECLRQAGRVDSHIYYLQNKILEESNNNVVESLTKRIQQLGTSRVTIKLSNDSYSKKHCMMIDRCLKAIKVALTYGVVEHDGMTLPSSSLYAGKYYSDKFKETFQNLGALIK